MNTKGTEEKAFIEIISSYDAIDKYYLRLEDQKRHLFLFLGESLCQIFEVLVVGLPQFNFISVEV